MSEQEELMINPLHTTSTPSQYGLISIRDLETVDTPDMETGKEEIVTHPEHALVRAQFDSDGDVDIEVHAGGEENFPAMRILFEGDMSFPSGEMCITDAADDDEAPFEFPRPGEWHVRIGVEGPPRPNVIRIFLDRNEWHAATS